MNLTEHLKRALERREPLLQQLAKENTTAFRLFHGTAEGQPGVTIDIYGNLVLIQSFHVPLLTPEIAEIESFLSTTSFQISAVDFCDRSSPGSKIKSSSLSSPQNFWFQENGVELCYNSKHTGHDPLLFLDFRSTRRFLSQISQNQSVLNLFSYTCGAGVAAAVFGAIRVCNVDFAESALQYGRMNAQKNGVLGCSEFVHSDFFTAARQMAGLKISKRGAARTIPFRALPQQQFDIVLLDPPRFAKSPFGTVDLINDYQSLFKPALLVTKPGGVLICTNNVAKVKKDEWELVLLRCAEKAGAPLEKIDFILPDADFPSFDGNPPLKVAVCYPR